MSIDYFVFTEYSMLEARHSIGIDTRIRHVDTHQLPSGYIQLLFFSWKVSVPPESPEQIGWNAISDAIGASSFLIRPTHTAPYPHPTKLQVV